MMKPDKKYQIICGSIKDKYFVQIVTRTEYSGWLLKKHYAHRMPSVEYAYGLYDIVLEGVVTFGTPPYPNLRTAFGEKFKLIELNRLIVNANLPNNTLSFFVAQALHLLPKPLIIVSYADISQGHNGYIYQACNFIYTGLSAKRTEWKIKGLEHLHGTTIADISRGQKNRVEYMRLKYGDNFYLQDRPRKHRYFYFLGNKKDVCEMKKLLPYPKKPYPKGDNKRYDASYEPEIQNLLF